MSPREIAMGVNSALYTLCCFAAGLATSNKYAWGFAILAFGAQTLGCMVPRNPISPVALECTGIVAGVFAGIALLFPV